MSFKYFKFFIVIFIVALIGAAGLLYWRHNRLNSPPPTPQTTVHYNEPKKISPDDNTLQNQPNIPDSLLIKVPFTAQAPTANWDELHEAACEETAAIMANAYFKKIKTLPPEIVEAEITRLTQWQDKYQGYHLDQTSGEVSKMIELVYGLKTELKTLDEIALKQALTDNKLVLISFNGQLLNNPHFKQPGPIHHMLVITGFQDGKFITNDPGTKFGENYQYDFATLQIAAADWNHNTNTIDDTKKLMIIVSN